MMVLLELMVMCMAWLQPHLSSSLLSHTLSFLNMKHGKHIRSTDSALSCGHFFYSRTPNYFNVTHPDNKCFLANTVSYYEKESGMMVIVCMVKKMTV